MNTFLEMVMDFASRELNLSVGLLKHSLQDKHFLSLLFKHVFSLEHTFLRLLIYVLEKAIFSLENVLPLSLLSHLSK